MKKFAKTRVYARGETRKCNTHMTCAAHARGVRKWVTFKKSPLYRYPGLPHYELDKPYFLVLDVIHDSSNSHPSQQTVSKSLSGSPYLFKPAGFPYISEKQSQIVKGIRIDENVIHQIHFCWILLMSTGYMFIAIENFRVFT